MDLDYFIADVFTGAPLQGNPLAVVMNTCGLATERMQAIAREFNLSETAFVERRPAGVEQAEGVRVRIFTTREELNFAGHPTLGTACVLSQQAPETVRGGVVTLALNVGPVPVEFSGSAPGVGVGGGALYGTMTQRDPEFGAELAREHVARLAGLAIEDLDPGLAPQIVSTGTGFAIVVLRSAEALARLHVDQEAATLYLRKLGARWFYVLAPALGPSRDPVEWAARMQFNGGEDPATGSAAGCAIGYLVRHGAVASGAQVHLRQGIEIGRPSDLYVSARNEIASTGAARVTAVRVGGRTVLVAKGNLFLP